MKLTRIYSLLADDTRLRILNLLAQGPLCVCHLQQVLRAPQAKISKHLASLRQLDLVTCHRHRNWMIYELPKKPTPVLSAHLKSLMDCPEAVFQKDNQRLKSITKEAKKITTTCC